MKPRRAALGVLLSLSACGFHPLNLSSGRPASGTVAVASIPERDGQLLRLALQSRLGEASAARWNLIVSYTVAEENFAFRPDESATRQRWSARAAYTVERVDTPGRTVARGSVFATDGQNTFNGQFLAADLGAETIRARLADRLATDIVDDLAIRGLSN